MASSKRSPEELLRVLSTHLSDELLSDDYPLEEVERGLREAGADPKEIGRWGTNLAAELQRKRRLAWQREATRTRDQMQATLAGRAPLPAMKRAELIARLEAARRDPNIAMAARNLDEHVASDEALQQLVDSLDALATLGKGGGGTKEEE